MRNFILSLGLLVSVAAAGQQVHYAPTKEEKKVEVKKVEKSEDTTSTTTSTNPKGTTATATATATVGGSDCPPPAPAPTPKPKPKPTPNKPKPKPPAPAPRPCPKPKTCSKCPEAKTDTKVIEKVVEKTKYVDRTVTIDKAPKNTFSILAGVGPSGIVTDYYETRDRPDEYSFRKDKDKPKGFLMGIQYQYRIDPVSLGIMGLTNSTVMGSVGFNW